MHAFWCSGLSWYFQNTAKHEVDHQQNGNHGLWKEELKHNFQMAAIGDGLDYGQKIRFNCYSMLQYTYSVYSISISLRKFEIHVLWDFGWTDNGWLLVSGLKEWCNGSITVVNHCQISNSRVFRSMWWVFQEFILPWLDCPSYWNNYSTYPQVDIEIIMFLKYCCYTFQEPFAIVFTHPGVQRDYADFTRIKLDKTGG
jgi:hypothetical protein